MTNIYLKERYTYIHTYISMYTYIDIYIHRRLIGCARIRKLDIYMYIDILKHKFELRTTNT